MRYDSLIALAARLQPANILEIGVASGNTAIRLLEVTDADYYGVDLFENLTLEMAKAELNGKAVMSLEDVWEKLGAYHERVSLYRGNSRDILPALSQEWLDDGILFDLIFIDGGHSHETIASDYNCAEEIIAADGVIVFDDYYQNGAAGFGCNETVDELVESGYGVTFSAPDIMRNGLAIQLASITYH